ncbi:MAG: single-stranded DNA-binding protein [Candidatus Aminicenantes bacterium]|nr:single-stranded DNA-binding protein [Candidatus Aminicenantes bacterium]
MRDVNSLNKVILIGHLGRKPELRFLPQSERAIARFTLATNERTFNPQTKESRDYTEWHKIVAWGKLAEFAEKYLSQGRQVLVEGRLRTRTWQDKDGNKRSTTEIEANNIVFLGRREGAAEPVAQEPFPSEPAVPDFPGEDDTSGPGGPDDVPF